MNFSYLYDMAIHGGIEARLMWMLLSGAQGVLEEPAVDYGGMLERMEAEELLALMAKVQERLKAMGVSADATGAMLGSDAAAPVELYIDRQYTIRMEAPDGPALPLRPLVKALFILFLRHPEGILLKQRDQYRQELEEIYAVICPNTAVEDVRARVGRLVNLQDNSFSEKASVLNARLEELLPAGTAEDYKIHGYNGHPRRIPLNSLLVHWFGDE
ncbi:MAG: hypothetical protein IKZ51_02555 [Bacteroidales bacterium]|nr:hypothetical protein [Bacteroidales bacterium]